MKKKLGILFLLPFLLFCCKKEVNKNKEVVKNTNTHDSVFSNLLVLTGLSDDNLLNLDSIDYVFNEIIEDSLDFNDSDFLLKTSIKNNKGEIYLPISIFKFSEVHHPFSNSISFHVDSLSNETEFVYNSIEYVSKEKLKDKLIKSYYDVKNDTISDSNFKQFNINILIEGKYNSKSFSILINKSTEAFYEILDKESKFYFGKYFRNLNDKELKGLNKYLFYFGFERLILVDSKIVDMEIK